MYIIFGKDIWLIKRLGRKNKFRLFTLIFFLENLEKETEDNIHMYIDFRINVYNLLYISLYEL